MSSTPVIEMLDDWERREKAKGISRSILAQLVQLADSTELVRDSRIRRITPLDHSRTSRTLDRHNLASSSQLCNLDGLLSTPSSS